MRPSTWRATHSGCRIVLRVHSTIAERNGPSFCDELAALTLSQFVQVHTLSHESCEPEWDLSPAVLARICNGGTK